MELVQVKVVARASLPVRVCSKVPIWPCCVAVKDGHHMPIQFSAPLQAGLVRADFEHVSTSLYSLVSLISQLSSFAEF